MLALLTNEYSRPAAEHEPPADTRDQGGGEDSYLRRGEQLSFTRVGEGEIGHEQRHGEADAGQSVSFLRLRGRIVDPILALVILTPVGWSVSGVTPVAAQSAGLDAVVALANDGCAWLVLRGRLR